MDKNKKSCRNCGKCDNPRRCKGCFNVFYCSKECQHKDWKNHKQDCGKIKWHPQDIKHCFNKETGKKIKWKDIVLLIKSTVLIMNDYPNVREDLKEVITCKIIIYAKITKLKFSDIEKKIRLLNLPFYLIATKIPKKARILFKNNICDIYRKPMNSKYIMTCFTGYYPKEWNNKLNLKRLEKSAIIIYDSKNLEHKKKLDKFFLQQFK